MSSPLHAILITMRTVVLLVIMPSLSELLISVDNPPRLTRELFCLIFLLMFGGNSTHMKPFTRIRWHLALPTTENSCLNKSDHEPNQSTTTKSPHQEGANPGASDDHRQGFPPDQGQTSPTIPPRKHSRKVTAKLEKIWPVEKEF